MNQTWTIVVKKKKKLLIAMSEDGKIVDTGFTQKGNIGMNFEDEKKRDEASQ